MPLIDATKNKKKKAGSSSSVTPTASTPSITYEKLTALSGQGDKVASALLASGRYKPSVGVGGQDGGEWGVLDDSEAIKAGLPTTGFESTIPKGNGGVYPQNLRQAMGGRAGRVAGVNPVSVSQMGRKGMASTLGRTANSAGAYYGSAGTDTSSTGVYDGRGVDRSMGVGGNGGLYDDLMSYLSPDSVIDRQKKIRQELERSRQSQLDAIKQKYSSQMDQRQQQGQEDLARMRSMNLRAGLGGSDFGAANKEQVREGVRKDFRMMEANRDMEIGNVINEIDQLAQQQFQIEQNAMRQNFSTAMEYQQYVQGQQQMQRQQTVERVAALGKAGLDLASIKERDPQLYENLTAASGMGDVELEAVLNNNKPAPAKIDYQYKVAGGRIIAFGIDPTTGQMKVIEQDAGLPDNYKTLTAEDGTILGIPENWDGDTSKIVTVGNYRKPFASEMGGGGGGTGLTPYQTFQATQSLKKTTQTLTAAQRELSRQTQLMNDAWQRLESGQAKDLNATSQAIITTFNKILDETSVVRETEYDRTPAGQSLIANIEGRINKITQGGPGLTKESLKELVDLGNTFNKRATAYMNERNAAAREEALFFGLNPDFVAPSPQDQQPVYGPQQPAGYVNQSSVDSFPNQTDNTNDPLGLGI